MSCSSCQGLSRYEFGGFGEHALTFDEAAKPVLIGGGIGLAAAAATRGLSPAGTWVERHAGLVGGAGGGVVAYFAKQGGAGAAAALMAGLAVEIMEWLTTTKMTS